ncbi:MAG TPA: prepilin-type N-terminal cleavage/methylation domain-containing protein [Planctomycetota bacterium]|nr:prepilin-type N-terminal cleavage/methylation domain-containing protein [Planctomycetota bacterium]
MGIHGRRSGGFTLLEVMIALAVLATAVFGFISAILHTSRLNAANRETLAAMRGAERMIETLRDTDFDKVFASYNRVPSDDPPPGYGTAPGSDFDVEGLSPVPGDPDGKCGKILFPTDSSGGQLREDTVDPDLLMPRDLDGSGTIDRVDVSAGCKILPVEVRIDGLGIQGARSWTYRYVFLKRE